MMNIQQTVKAEIAWYTTVIPTIKDFQREFGVEQVADFFQNFFGARISLDPSSEIVDINPVILTENLVALGFKNIDRHVGFDLETSKAILRDLATFHAVPLVMRIKNKELFDKNIKPYLTSFYLDNPLKEGQDFFNGIKGLFEELPETSPYVDKILTYLKNHEPYSKKQVVREPWGSICHNDFYINNIMVKKGDDLKMVFLDFQLTGYGSIAIDVLYLLIVSVAQEVVTDHMDELIKYYWDEFLKNLVELHMDTSKFSFEDFLKEIDDAASSGLFSRALLHTFAILLDRGHAILDSSDENYVKESKAVMSFNERQKNKYKWLALEFIKRGWM